MKQKSACVRKKCGLSESADSDSCSGPGEDFVPSNCDGSSSTVPDELQDSHYQASHVHPPVHYGHCEGHVGCCRGGMAYSPHMHHSSHSRAPHGHMERWDSIYSDSYCLFNNTHFQRLLANIADMTDNIAALIARGSRSHECCHCHIKRHAHVKSHSDHTKAVPQPKHHIPQVSQPAKKPVSNPEEIMRARIAKKKDQAKLARKAAHEAERKRKEEEEQAARRKQFESERAKEAEAEINTAGPVDVKALAPHGTVTGRPAAAGDTVTVLVTQGQGTGKLLHFMLGAGQVSRLIEVTTRGMLVNERRLMTIPPSKESQNSSTNAEPTHVTLERVY